MEEETHLRCTNCSDIVGLDKVRSVDDDLLASRQFANLQKSSCQVGDDEEEGGDGVAGLQQGDREGEDEVTRHHQQQQDPEHVCHQGSINADEEDENYFKPGCA